MSNDGYKSIVVMVFSMRSRAGDSCNLVVNYVFKNIGPVTMETMGDIRGRSPEISPQTRRKERKKFCNYLELKTAR